MRKPCKTCCRLTSGQTGTLFVTTFKLHFKLHVEAAQPASNKFLGESDCSLSSIQVPTQAQSLVYYMSLSVLQ